MGAETKSTAEKLKLARERRAAFREKVEALTDKMGEPDWNDAVDAPLLAAEQRSWSQSNDQVISLEQLLDTEKRDLGDQSGETPAITANFIPTRTADTEAGVRKQFSFFRGIRGAMKGKLDGLELEMHKEGILEARKAKVDDVPDESGNGFMVPTFISHDPYTEKRRLELDSVRERRDMVVGTTTAGGHLVSTDLGGLIPFLDPAMRIRDLGARYLTGLVGNLDLPRRTARATGGWATEVAALSQSDPTFDKISMTPKRVGTYIESSIQLFNQSSVDVENLIREDLQQCVAETVETAALNGSGSGGQPTGLLNTSGIGDVAGGTNGLAPTWSHIVDLETDLTQAKAAKGRLGYYTTPGVAGKLKKTTRDGMSGYFIWEGPAANGFGVLNGYSSVTGTLMPSTLTKGTSSGVCHAIVFGNWQEMIIGQWAGLYIVVNPYTLDTNSEVRVTVSGWFDVAIRHAASFSAMQDALVS